MTHENDPEAFAHEGVRITRLPPSGKTGPQYKVEIACLEGEWLETYGSPQEIRAFFKGIEAAQFMSRWVGKITIPESTFLRGFAAANGNDP
jgi:hypothetical protein